MFVRCVNVYTIQYDTPIIRAHQTSSKYRTEESEKQESSRNERKSEKNRLLCLWHRATLNGGFICIYESVSQEVVQSASVGSGNNLAYTEVFIIMDQIKTLGFGSLDFFLVIMHSRSEQEKTSDLFGWPNLCPIATLHTHIQLDTVDTTANKQIQMKWPRAMKWTVERLCDVKLCERKTIWRTENRNHRQTDFILCVFSLDLSSVSAVNDIFWGSNIRTDSWILVISHHARRHIHTHPIRRFLCRILFRMIIFTSLFDHIIILHGDFAVKIRINKYACPLWWKLIQMNHHWSNFQTFCAYAQTHTPEKNKFFIPYQIEPKKTSKLQRPGQSFFVENLFFAWIFHIWNYVRIVSGKETGKERNVLVCLLSYLFVCVKLQPSSNWYSFIFFLLSLTRLGSINKLKSLINF